MTFESRTVSVGAKFVQPLKAARTAQPVTRRDPSNVPPNARVWELVQVVANDEHLPVLHIGLSAWIVQDGNYGEFTVGQRAKFALEFGPLLPLRRAQDGPLLAEHIGASRYRVRAKVVFLERGVWVIDTGSFAAYQECQPPHGLLVGTLLEGEVYLGIDPFFYFERLHEIGGMPALSYRWLVRNILRETTPWREGKLENGTPIRTRDETSESFVPVSNTDAWHDDGGNGHYVMACSKEGGPETP